MAPTDTAPDPLQRIRESCLALPDVVERDSHGAPAWWIGDGRSFALFADHHRDDRLGLWLASDEDTQHEMLTRDPVRFYRPPYLGWRHWLAIGLESDPDWAEVDDFVRQAHHLVSARTGRTGAS